MDEYSQVTLISRFLQAQQSPGLILLITAWFWEILQGPPNVGVYLSSPWLHKKTYRKCPTKVCLVKAIVFPVSFHVWIWELDYKEGWMPKNWCFWTVVLGKTLESPLDCKEIQPVNHCKEIQPVNPKGNQPWKLIGRNDAEAETPVLWPPDAKNRLNGKHPDAGKDWRWEKGTTEDEMVGWHHRRDGHVFEKAPGVGDGQKSLACCSLWSCKQSDTTEWLNWTLPGTWKNIQSKLTDYEENHTTENSLTCVQNQATGK